MGGVIPSVEEAALGLAHHEFTTSDGVRLPYRRAGTGPLLVLLHGWSQSGAMFGHQLSALSADYTVVVPDLRGQGRAAAVRRGLRMSRLAADLNELLDHLHEPRANLLGWSMGASVIWSFIDLFGTGRIDRLVLVDQPSMLTHLPEMSPETVADCGAIFTMPALDALCAQLRGPDANETRTAFLRGMVTPDISPALFDFIAAEAAQTDAAAAADLLWSHCSQDWRDVLPRIDRPTLVICGAVSHVNVASQVFVHRQIAESSLREFSRAEGGAHFPFLESPATFNQAITAFLRQNPAEAKRSRNGAP